jgi:hypothetical protein
VLSLFLHAGLKCWGQCRGSLPSQARELAREADEPKPVCIYKVDLLERKERLQLEKCSRAPKSVTRCSGEGWGF